MKPNKPGVRHPLLLYRRSMGRVWKATFALGLVTAVVGWFSLLEEITILGFSSILWLFAIVVLSFAVSGFAFLARYLAYVRVHPGYFSVVTPFLRFKISFRRMRSVHPVLMQQVFPKTEAHWAQRNFLQPFYGKTALIMELQSYPMKLWLLKLFLPAPMFSPRSTGFVWLVPDWMKLSTELDSAHGAWLQIESARRRQVRK
ncbi:MAG: hypothetical protein JXA78_10735 [Anaerolineales bacterium]|nr:hypothetical protein [Anaerolineales bacterium]